MQREDGGAKAPIYASGDNSSPVFKPMPAGEGEPALAGAFEADSPLMIEAEGLGLRTALGRVFEEVSLRIPAGAVCALFGSEGCGKTSLLLTLSGRMRFQEGSATVASYDLAKQSRKVRRISGISVIERVNDVPENLLVRDIMAAELQLCGKSASKSATAAYLERWEFSEFADTPYRSLDSYERITFGIMLALAPDPQLLLVDDVQTGLSQHQSLRMVKHFHALAKTLGVTVIFATNDYDIANCAHGMVILSEKAFEQSQAALRDHGWETVRLMGVANGVQAGEWGGALDTSAPACSTEEEA